MRKLLTMVCSVLLAMSAGWAAFALQASELQDVRVLHYHFAVRVAGSTGTVGSRDPGQARMLVVVISAARERRSADRVFARDFVLCYQHPDGREDRAGCDMISVLPEEEEDVSPGLFASGIEPSAVVEGAQVRIGLVFFVENDVRRVELWRIGTPETVIIDLGEERPFSIFVTTPTNRAVSARVAAELNQLDGVKAYPTIGLRSGGVKDVTLFRSPDVPDNVVRAVAERLEAVVGRKAEIEDMDEAGMRSDYDIVVWLP